MPSTLHHVTIAAYDILLKDAMSAVVGRSPFAWIRLKYSLPFLCGAISGKRLFYMPLQLMLASWWKVDLSFAVGQLITVGQIGAIDIETAVDITAVSNFDVVIHHSWICFGVFMTREKGNSLGQWCLKICKTVRTISYFSGQ